MGTKERWQRGKEGRKAHECLPPILVPAFLLPRYQTETAKWTIARFYMFSRDRGSLWGIHIGLSSGCF